MMKEFLCNSNLLTISYQSNWHWTKWVFTRPCSAITPYWLTGLQLLLWFSCIYWWWQDYYDHYGMCHCSKKRKNPSPVVPPLFLFFISVSPHVLPHIKYSIVLPLEISIINKQNSSFCFEMEHHAGLERKHISINLWFPIFLESRDTCKTPTLFPTIFRPQSNKMQLILFLLF